MEDLFRQFWWLIFPLAWIVGGMVTSFLNYRRQQKTLDLIKAYADKGQEPPAALMKVLDRPIDSDTEFWQGRSKSEQSDGGSWFCVVLFAGLAAGFGFAAWQDYYEAGDGLMIVTFIMAALSLAFLASALASRRKRP